MTTQFHFDLRTLTRALGGEVVGSQVLAPGPGHGPRDRSLSVKLSATSPDGFIVYSHAGDDWRACGDYVRAALGVTRESRSREKPTLRSSAPKTAASDASRIKSALEIWRESGHPGGTPVEPYLESRGLALEGELIWSLIRWHEEQRAMVALIRNIETNAPQAISRTFLDNEGRKLGRKFLGPVGGAAIKLDPDENVLGGLHIGEGIETVMSARQLGLRLAWALGSAGAIGAFPVLDGIECLTLLAEHDEASAKAVQACADRWLAAGREVIVNEPIGGKDLNDSIRRGRHNG